MPLFRLCLVSVLLCAYPLVSQNRPISDSPSELQAVQIVESVLNSSGRAALQSVHDFRESGEVTYNWGTEPQHGTAIVSAIGASDFRLDFHLPGLDTSWFVSDGQGKFSQMGKTKALPLHAGANRGSLTLPAIRLTEAARGKFRFSYVERATRDGHDLYHLRAEKIPSAREAKDKAVSELETVDYFVDSNSFLIVRTEDVAHPPENMEIKQFHAIDYSDYRSVDGVQVPFSISEHIGNAETWSLQLNEVSLNAGIRRSDIEF